MDKSDARIAREKETVRTMVGMYCRGNHGTRRGELCPECSELLEYSMLKIECCPAGENKVRCSSCEIHCYSPEMRDRIRTVMRYSGPRMVLHPGMALRHMLG